MPRKNRKLACVMCGGPCNAERYRCAKCGLAERVAFDRCTGRGKHRVIAAHSKMRSNAAERLAEIDADRRLGIDAIRIAADQGTTMRALEKFAQRHERSDLAAFFRTTRPSTSRRTGTCVTCGGECYYDSRRCVSCFAKWMRGDAA